jgi:hypothetical protein
MDFNKLQPESEERPEDTEWFIAAKNRVSRLGVVLIATAIICGLSNLGGLMVASAIRRQNPPAQPPKNMSPEDQKQWERGRDSAPLIDFACVGAVSMIYLPVFLGGLALQRGSGRGLGMTAAVIAMLPCSPGFLLGLPIGIWALFVLNNQDAIHVLEHKPRDEDDRDRRRR